MKTQENWLSQNPAVTIDGCKLACATKMVEESGGTVAKDFAVLDVYRKHRQFKPKGIAELNEGGDKIGPVLAEEVAEVVDSLDINTQMIGNRRRQQWLTFRKRKWAL